MAHEPLSEDAIHAALEDLDAWEYEDDAITTTFEFTDYRAATSFLVRLSYYAEDLNHHPQIFNVYNTVELTLTTHDAGNKVTDLDIQLANLIEDFVWV